MTTGDEHRIDDLIAKLSALSADRRYSGSPARRAADVFITPVEVNESHGTGVLLRALFGGDPAVVSLRSADQYGGRADFGISIKLAHANSTRDQVFSRVAEAFRDFDVRRIVCAPYNSSDVSNAIAVHAIYGAPMCAWIMDDQNIELKHIEDQPMRELLERSSVRFAISPEIRAAYEHKFGLPFYHLPPLVPARMLPARLHVPDAPPDARHGVMIGNSWSPRALDLLRRTVRDSGVTLSYPGAAARDLGVTFLSESPGIPAEALRKDGIHRHDFLDEPELVAMLRSLWFAVVPSGTLDEFEDRRWLAAMSLPSRLVYMTCVAQIPVIVLGSRDTAAAHFVEKFGIGVNAGYGRESFLKAVEYVTGRDVNLAMRRRALAISGRFSDAGVGEWIWQSLARGEPFDQRFEDLMAGESLNGPGTR
jgi:hypothetical protein